MKNFLLTNNQNKDKMNTFPQSGDISEESKVYSHMRNCLNLFLFTDHRSLNLRNANSFILSRLKIRASSHSTYSSHAYFPIFYIDDLTDSSRHYTLLAQNANIPISVTIAPISYAQLSLWLLFENQLKHMQQIGFKRTDLDDIKELFGQDHLYLLVLSLVVIVGHTLFAILSFTSDINFWSSRESTAGVSRKSVLFHAISQIVVLLYIRSESTSIFVSLSVLATILTEVWKCCIAFKLSMHWRGSIPQFFSKTKNEMELTTEKIESEVVYALSYILYPLCFLYSLYSILFNPHKSFYSWCISCTVNIVYGLGFAYMLPQLVINYRLKSVDHLSWSALTYRALNTFMDDIVAFLIPMPVAHRIACFRDDVIFIIYLYQRWLYRSKVAKDTKDKKIN